MNTTSTPAPGRGFLSRGRKNSAPGDTQQSIDQMVGSLRKAARVKIKADVPTLRRVLSSDFQVTGNDLSHIVVGDLGNREAVVLVSEQSLGKPLHVDTRQKLITASYAIAFERIAPVAVITDLNKAINGNGDDDKSSDAKSLVEELIHAAIDDDATDIHLCCREKTGMALFRVHSRIFPNRQYGVEECKQMAGYLFTHMSEPKTRSHNTFSLENKSMSCMVKMRFKATDYKLRYKYIRLVDGWDMVIRILAVETLNERNKTFEDSGYEVSQIKLLKLCVSRAIGLIAFLGPTGSGKSTSLKICMEADPNRKQRKRYSVEDPVEYKIYDLSQISVQKDDHEDQIDSIKALNGTLLDILRGDPDEIMVGETRDASTASIVADFVMTGHKLYTTLHIFSAFGAILRLNRLGLDRNVLADRQFFSALAFQRLLPVLCDHCKVPATEVLPDEKLQQLQEKFGLDISKIYCSAESGCEHCKGRGITGSTVVAEIVAPDKVIRNFIADSKDEQAEVYWRESRVSAFDDPDMTGKTAYEHALYKISQGRIDPRDLEREFEPLEVYELVEVSL
ncbi:MULTISPECIES: ATPase, T2SS/T4P/T4SS family [unclassified Pseudomonas]|uniref:GspE/PulE family protein n=1 Tax=unclassified Pseudomonas TaxID=196821 RepID=UPI001F56D406|nr:MULTISPECIES: ATPase, T2SS/T4P/T4SS family [unclassified Pseudomonas]